MPEFGVWIQAKSPPETLVGEAEFKSIFNISEINVKSYGAVGDGVTDDTAAIQSALSAKKVVHFPAGIYKVTDTLDVAHPFKITGDGPELSVIEFNGMGGLSGKDGLNVVVSGADYGAASILSDITVSIKGEHGRYAIVTPAVGGLGLIGNVWSVTRPQYIFERVFMRGSARQGVGSNHLFDYGWAVYYSIGDSYMSTWRECSINGVFNDSLDPTELPGSSTITTVGISIGGADTTDGGAVFMPHIDHTTISCVGKAVAFGRRVSNPRIVNSQFSRCGYGIVTHNTLSNPDDLEEMQMSNLNINAMFSGVDLRRVTLVDMVNVRSTRSGGIFDTASDWVGFNFVGDDTKRIVNAVSCRAMDASSSTGFTGDKYGIVTVDVGDVNISGFYIDNRSSNGFSSGIKITDADRLIVDGVVSRGALDTVLSIISTASSAPSMSIDGILPNSSATALITVDANTLFSNTSLHETPAGRNFLRNPGFNITQRGEGPFTSTTNPANNDDTYLFDGCILLSDGNDIVDVQRTTNRSIIEDGCAFGMQSIIETANKKFLHLWILSAEDTKTIYEDGNGVCSAAVTIDLNSGDQPSFGNMRLMVIAWTGTADQVTSDIVSAWGAGASEPTLIADLTVEGNLSITPTTSPVRYKLPNIKLDTDNTKNLIFAIVANDDSTTVDDVMTLSGPKLEAGPLCTKYIERHVSEELRLCRYWFWRRTRTATAEKIAQGYNTSTTSAEFMLTFDDMNSSPTINFSAVSDFTVNHTNGNTDTTDIVASGITRTSATLTATVASGLTDGQGSSLQTNATANSFIEGTCEL